MAIITNSVAKDNTNLEDQHKVITLDLDTRKFDGPNNYVVAIKGDSNSQKLTFVTPMEYDGVDLFGTTCVLTYWTSWTNDEGIHSKGEITLIPEEFEDKLKYTWVLDPNQTAKAGEVRFKIGFYLNLDDDFYYDYSNYQELQFVFTDESKETSIKFGNTIVRTTYKYYALVSNSGKFVVEEDGIGNGSEVKLVDYVVEFDERISNLEAIQFNKVLNSTEKGKNHSFSTLYQTTMTAVVDISEDYDAWKHNLVQTNSWIHNNSKFYLDQIFIIEEEGLYYLGGEYTYTLEKDGEVIQPISDANMYVLDKGNYQISCDFEKGVTAFSPVLQSLYIWGAEPRVEAYKKAKINLENFTATFTHDGGYYSYFIKDFGEMVIYYYQDVKEYIDNSIEEVEFNISKLDRELSDISKNISDYNNSIMTLSGNLKSEKQLRYEGDLSLQNSIKDLEDRINKKLEEYVPNTNVASKYEIWDGSTAVFSVGTGTEEDPFLISTPQQLALMVDCFGQGQYYKLTNDIYLNDIFNGIWTNEWYFSTLYGSWPYSRRYMYHQKGNIYAEGRFEGHIDGDGHTIYGLYHTGIIDNGYVFDTALIPVMKSGSIKNLNIDVANLKAGENVAAFVARANGDNKDSDKIIIENCSVQKEASICIVSTIIKEEASGGGGEPIIDGAAAGFVAYSMKGADVTIKNCYCLSEKISGDHYAQNYFKYAAFIGQTWDSYYKILNCYSLMSPFNFVDNSFNNRISLYQSDGYSNIYTCTTRSVEPSELSYFALLTREQMIGPNALNQMSGLSQAGFVATDEYPIIQHLINNNVDKLAVQNMLNLASMATILGGMSNIIPNLKVEIKNVNGALGTTQIPAGKIKVEPNKFYVASSQTSGGGVGFTAWTGTEVKTYDAKLVMMFVGEKVNGIAPGYVVHLSDGIVPTFSPWPLMQGAINDSVIVNGQGFTSEIELDEKGTIMILN